MLKHSHQPGQRRHWHRQVSKFLLVGVLNAALDLGVFNLLLVLGPTRDAGQLVIYNTIAVGVAILNSYFWNSRWTFGWRPGRERARDSWRRRGMFAAQAGLNIAVNNGVLAGLASIFALYRIMPAITAGDVSKIVAALVASAVSFLMMKFVVFRWQVAPNPTATML